MTRKIRRMYENIAFILKRRKRLSLIQMPELYTIQIILEKMIMSY